MKKKPTHKEEKPGPLSQQLKEYCKMTTAHRFHCNTDLSIYCLLSSKLILLYCCKVAGSIACYCLLMSLRFKTLHIENDGGVLRREMFCILVHCVLIHQLFWCFGFSCNAWWLTTLSQSRFSWWFCCKCLWRDIFPITNIPGNCKGHHTTPSV